MLSLYHSYLHDELSVFSKLLLNYDFINYFPNDLELLNLWEKNLNIKNSVMLQSNGSTLDYQNYKFGPLASLVEIERILKYRYYKTFFLIGNNEGYNAISQSKNPMYDYYYHFDYQKPIHNLLWQHIHEKVVLSAQPHTWLTLTSDEEFLQGLNKEYILNRFYGIVSSGKGDVNRIMSIVYDVLSGNSLSDEEFKDIISYKPSSFKKEEDE
jgi:hypothetical protein